MLFLCIIFPFPLPFPLAIRYNIPKGGENVMGFLTNAKGSIISEYFWLLDGFRRLPAGETVKVFLYRNYLDIFVPKSKTTLTLQYSSITDVYYGKGMASIKPDFTTMVGRMLVGDMLMGDVGSFMGALSCQYKEKQKVQMLVIYYRTNTGEIRFLRLNDIRKLKGKKLSQKLRALCGMPPQYGR